MDQTLFEEALKGWVKKVVDKDNGSVTYNLLVNPRKSLLSTSPSALATHRAREEGKRKRLSGEPGKAVDYDLLRKNYKVRKKVRIHTPDGWFDHPIDAAEHFSLTMPQLRARIQQCKVNKRGNKDWYYEEQ